MKNFNKGRVKVLDYSKEVVNNILKNRYLNELTIMDVYKDLDFLWTLDELKKFNKLLNSVDKEFNFVVGRGRIYVFDMVLLLKKENKYLMVDSRGNFVNKRILQNNVIDLAKC